MSEQDQKLYAPEELLLALEVRKSAYSARRQAMPRHLVEEGSPQEIADWESSHPVEPYYELVVGEAVKSADIIRGILKR